MKKTIVLLKCGDFSGTNNSIKKILGKHFSVHEIDAGQALHFKKHPLNFVINMFYAFLRFGKKWRIGLVRTDYAFRSMSKYCEKELSKLTFDIIFQTQTLFSCSRRQTYTQPYYIYTDHTMEISIKNYKNCLKPSEKWLKMEHKTYKNAKNIFTMSEFIKHSFVKDYNISPNTVINIGVGPNIFNNENPPSHKVLKTKATRILFVGKDFQRKGGYILLKAFKKVREQLLDVTLIIVGCELNINMPSVIFKGYIDKHQVVKEFEGADLFVLPALQEPFGIVFIEAMASKVSCIGTTIESIPEIIQDGKNGLLVQPGNVDDLAHKITTLIKDHQLRKKMGEEGYRLYLKKYNWHTVEEKLLSFLEDKIKET